MYAKKAVLGILEIRNHYLDLSLNATDVIEKLFKNPFV